MFDRDRIFYLRLVERAAATFVQAFLAVWIVTGNLDRVTLSTAAVAGAAAVVKGLGGSLVGDKNSPGLLPSPPEPEDSAELIDDDEFVEPPHGGGLDDYADTFGEDEGRAMPGDNV